MLVSQFCSIKTHQQYVVMAISSRYRLYREIDWLEVASISMYNFQLRQAIDYWMTRGN